MMYKNLSKILFLTVFSCCVVSSTFTMHHGGSTGPQGYPDAKAFVKSWAPTWLACAGLALYTFRYDRQFPARALSTMKQTLFPALTPKKVLVTYPTLAVAGHAAYGYYQPRLLASYHYLKATINSLF